MFKYFSAQHGTHLLAIFDPVERHIPILLFHVSSFPLPLTLPSPGIMAIGWDSKMKFLQYATLTTKEKVKSE